ncbi:mucin-3A-like [Haliotis rufescens]|uniref:mucin-3A-like n=1 Tax=Haliotis rufescens TaxID=6454 RepID=UPI00201E82E1|nr:mucin-3A-like [Haliotis rufescens]
MLTGTCATDVLITPDSKTGDHQICLNSRSSDPPRCFKVDPDASKPCAVTSCGHGVCIVETDHTSTCLCDDVHSGDSCNKETPCKSSPCQNHGACENDGKNPICHCPIGYTGVNCETGIHVPLHQKPTFTGPSMENGGVFNCVKDQTCTIPLSISKGQGPAPVIKVGPHSNGLTVKSPDPPTKDTDTPGRQDLYTSQMHITPTEAGEKKVCVKTGSDTTDVDSANADTVCYHLHVTDTGTATPVSKDSFHDPTPVSGSTIRCSQGKDCHMIVHTLPDNGGQCPQVTTDTSTANIFPTRKDTTWTDCITDVSVPAAIAQHPSTVCLKARQGEQPRCYSTKPTPPTDVCLAKGCNKLHGACILEKDDTASCLCDSPFKEPTCDPCQNHGISEGGTCHCPTGFTGLHCETAVSNPSKPQFTGPNPMNGATVECELGQTCHIPVYVRPETPGSTPSLSPGPTTLSSTSTISKPLGPDPGLPNTGIQKGEVQITPINPGIHDVCVKTSAGGKSDTICVKVHVKPTTGTPTVPNKDPFMSPTMPENSVLQCDQLKDCHVLVYTKPKGGTCPTVTKAATTKPDTHVFPTTKDVPSAPTTCVTDISITPDPSHPGPVCITAADSSTSKTRCFQIHVNTGPDPCSSPGRNCNNGACTRTDTVSRCVCDVGYTPLDDCHDKISTCSNGGQADSGGICHCPLGYSGVTCGSKSTGNTNTEPTFAENNIKNGGTIECETGKDCTFPVHTQAPSSNPNVAPTVDVGPTSGNVNVQVDPSHLLSNTDVPGLYEALATIKAPTQGTKKVCLKLTSSVDGSVCYNVEVKNKPSTAPPTGVTFTKSTPPDGSKLVCDRTECHILIHTKPMTTTMCDHVTTTTSSTVVFQTKKDGSDCVTDLAYTPGPSGSKQICVDAGTPGEHRCFEVTKAPLTDPCASETCNNHGSCLKQPTTAECVCETGFTGPKCQNPTTSPCSYGGKLETTTSTCNCPLGYSGITCDIGPTHNTGTTPKYAGNNVENGGTIKCVKGTPCVFPVHTRAPDGSHVAPTLTAGPTSGNVAVTVDPNPKLETTTGVPGLYSTPVTLTAPDKGPKRVCFKLTSATADSVCYNVDVTDGGVTAPIPTGSVFTVPTLPDGSSITCESECHVLVHSTLDPSSRDCKQVTPTSTTGTAFKTTQDGSDCVTDVLYKPESTNKKLCIDAGPSGEHRCYDVKKSPSTDPCATETCNNHGSCLKQPTTAECVCETGFTGSKCQNLATTIPCTNGGKLETTTSTCNCPLGYSGTTCDIGPTHNTGTTPKYAGNNVENGGTIKCVKGTPCVFPVHTQVPDGSHVAPTLKAGPTSGNVAVTVDPNPKLETTPGVPGLYSTPVTLTAPDKGPKRVCFKLTSATADSVCYNVDVTDGGVTAPVPTGSVFTVPTLPDGSSLTCESECHVLVHSTLDPSSRDCKQVTPTSTTGTAFKTTQDGSDCVTDVLYKPDSTNKKLCIDAGPSGEHRCYDVKKSPSTDPCATETCNNHGSCLKEPTTAECVCETGFTGPKCQTPTTSPCTNGGKLETTTSTCNCPLGYSGTTCDIGPTHNTGTTPKYAGNNVENGGTIKCVKGTPCVFPVHTQVPDGSHVAPTLKAGPTSGNVAVTVDPNPKLETTTGVPGLYSTPVTLTAPDKGPKRVCFKLTSATADSVCYNVDVTDGGVTAPTHIGSVFTVPTLPDGSSITCESECHVLVHSTLDPSSGDCKQVTPTSTTGTAFKTTQDGSDCVTDVLYKPDSTNKKLCIDAGPSGEHRCYDVKKSPSTDPCATETCNNHGSCLKQPTTAECVCETGFTGPKCQNPATTIPCSNGGKLETATSTCNCPLGYSGTTCDIGPTHNTGTTPKYAGNNVENGGTIKCVKGTPCVFPVHTQVPDGSLQVPTLKAGPTSGNVAVTVDPNPKLETTTGVPGLYSTPVTLTAPDKGPKRVCFKLTSATADSVCYNVDVTDGGVTAPVPTGSVFTVPTLPDGSSITCESECHVLVHSTLDPSSRDCKQVTPTSTTGTAFKTTQDGSDCVTDVLYKPDSTNKKLCIDAGPSGEHRCYDVKKSPSRDPCATETCNNHGSCFKEPTTAECVCETGFTGPKCQNPATTIPCSNGGKLETATSTCNCPLGYSGTTCDIGPTHNTGTTPKYAGNNVENGGTIKCVKGTPCVFPVHTQVPDGSLQVPTLKAGPTSGNVAVTVDPNPKLETTTGVPGLYSTPVTLTAPDKGPKRVCFKLTSATADSVCYNVDVTDGGVTAPVPTGSVFTVPTLPDGSSITCESECHVLVHSTLDPSSRDCKQVTPTSTTGTAFKTTQDGSDCVTDVLYKPDSTNKKLCIDAGPSGEHRCYEVKNSPSTDPCVTEQCSNHGSCLNQNTVPECVCDTGYTDDKCQTSVLQTLGIDDKKPHILEPTVTNGFVINCEIGKPCTIPVVASAGNTGSSLKAPVVDGLSSGTIPVPDGKGAFKVDIPLPTSTLPGETHHCVELESSSGVKSEPWCVVIKHTPPGSSSSTTDGFSSPTIPDGSVIPCTVGTTCTLPVTARPGHNLKTPIATTIPYIVEPGLTPATETKIKISPTDKNIGDNNVCVETQDGSSKRCYIVKVQSPGGVTATPGAGVGASTSEPGTLSGTLSGLGVDASKPHVLRPTLTSGTIIPCPTSCDVSILVEPGTNPQGGVEVVQTRGPPIATPTITQTPDGKFSIKVPIIPDSTKHVLQPVCFKVRNKLTSLEGNEWCANVNPTPHASTPKPSLGVTPKEIVSTSLPDNSVITCTVDTTCSVDMKTTPGTRFQPTTGAIPASVTTDPTDPDLHTLSVTPSQTDIGEHTVCATTTNNDRKCYTIKVTPNPNTFGKDPTKTHQPTTTNLPCGPNDHPEIVGAASSVECPSSKCSIHVLVKPPSCVTTNPISVNPVGTSQFSNGPIRSVGSYKDVEIQIGPSAPGSQNVCMKASAGVSLVSQTMCIKVETKLDPSGSVSPPGAKPKPAIPTHVTCTLGTQCPIPIVTEPDRVLQQSPSLPAMPPILSGSQSIQPVLYHATVPGHQHVCVQAESISDSNDVLTICMDVDVVAQTPEPAKQCTGATKQQMIEAYQSGRMTCQCTDPVTMKTTTVVRPRVSNSKLLSSAGIGFGSGVATLAVVALVYLTVTKLKSMPSSGGTSSRHMLNFDYDRNY